MNNLHFYKGYIAEGELKPYTIVAPGTADNQAKAATDKKAPQLGVVGQSGGADTDHTDVQLLGPEFVRIGAAVKAGQFFTADANSHAIPLAVQAGKTVHYTGRILESSTEVGAVVRCIVQPGVTIGS